MRAQYLKITAFQRYHGSWMIESSGHGSAQVVCGAVNAKQ